MPFGSPQQYFCHRSFTTAPFLGGLIGLCSGDVSMPDTNVAAEDLMTNEQVIDRLMMSETLRRAALRCVLPGILIGKEWYFRRGDLEAWIARQEPSKLD
jgi:hypothetical protein